MGKMKANTQESFWHLRTILLICAALFAIIFAILALRGEDNGQPAIVLTQEVEPGQLVGKTSFQKVILPPQAVPKDAVQDPTELKSASFVRYVSAGEVLTEHSVTGSARSRAIPSHKSVIQLSIPAVVAQGLTAGDNIDLWGVLANCPDETCEPHILARGAQVEHVSAPSEHSRSEQDQVTVAFLLDRAVVAEVLAVATGGTFHVALQSPIP